MWQNDQLEKWDRESFFHPSTHLAEFARGNLAQRVIVGGEGCYIGAKRNRTKRTVYVNLT